MENEINNSSTKSVWVDISRIWGRIAGVIAAVGVLSTFVTRAFNIPAELTYIFFTALGATLLMISFYVDKQTEYTHQEIVKSEKKARQDFTDIIEKQKEMSNEYRQDTERRIQHFFDSVEKIMQITQDTRKDTIRIQLLLVMEDQPDNIDTILRLAETYFIDLKGDWYMSNTFNKWAKQHDVVVPSNIYKAMDENHKDTQF